MEPEPRTSMITRAELWPWCVDTHGVLRVDSGKSRDEIAGGCCSTSELTRGLLALDSTRTPSASPQAAREPFYAAALPVKDMVGRQGGKLDLAVEPVKTLGTEGRLVPLGLIPGAASEGQSIATRAAYGVLLHAREAPSAGFRP